MSWYTFFVETGKEEIVCDYLNYILGNYSDIKYDMLIPKRELIEYKSGLKKIVYRTLFPGYIFVCTESIVSIYNAIRNQWHSDLYALLRTKDYFQEIRSEEIKPIINMIDNEGIISISTIFLEKDKVIITDGPLINYSGTIKKVNPRKERAKISLNFLTCDGKVDIGVRLLKKINKNDIKKIIIF